MNTSKLKKGETVKNYKELCLLLDEKVKTGNSKKAQLEHWTNYFQYEKQGTKFIIVDVFSENDIVKHEIARGRKSLYGNMIQVLLMDMLSCKKGNIIISKSALAKQLGLVNDNYNIGYNNQANLSNYLNIELDNVNEFYNINNANITSIINTAIHSLHNRRVIDCKIVTMVKYRGERNAHIANAYDRNDITEIDKECMLAFGIDSLEDLGKFNTNKKYFELIKYRKNLISTKTNIEFYYNAFDIVINHKYIKQENTKLTDYVLEEIKRFSTMIELNTIYSENSIANAEKRYNTPNNRAVRSNDSYIPYFKELVHNLISLSSEKFTLADIKNANTSLIDNLDLPF